MPCRRRTRGILNAVFFMGKGGETMDKKNQSMDTGTVAGRLKKAMTRRQIDGVNLSVRSGVSVSGISGYLHGRSKPTRRIAEKLAMALGVSTDWLLGVMPYEQENCENLISRESLLEIYERLNHNGRRYLSETARMLCRGNGGL